MLGYYHFSMIGTSHLAKNGVCQDASAVKTVRNGWVIGVIADGLGSANRSEIGASLAVHTVIDYIESHLPETWSETILKALLTMAYQEALEAINQRSKQENQPLSDYDTTLTTVVYNGIQVVYGHAGDGGIITLSNQGFYSVLTQRQKGDAWNEVSPLRQGPDSWEFGSSRDPVCSILMATDGVLDADLLPSLLSDQRETIHIPYVRSFMDRNILKVETKKDFDQVLSEVEKYYRNQKPQITDDKTLVCIINTDVIPDVREDSYYAEPDWGALKQKRIGGLYGHESSEKSETSQSRPPKVPPVIDTDDRSFPEDEEIITVCHPVIEEEPPFSEPLPPERKLDFRIILIILCIACVVVALIFYLPPLFATEHGVNNTSQKLEPTVTPFLTEPQKHADNEEGVDPIQTEEATATPPQTDPQKHADNEEGVNPTRAKEAQSETAQPSTASTGSP